MFEDILLGLKMVAGVCDGAHTLDNQGFSKIDAQFGKSLASKSFLTERQAEWGKKLVIKYSGQLPEDLVERVKSLEIVIHTPSAETSLNTLSFSSPKSVKGGTLQLETANPTQAFWQSWKANKDEFKKMGISVGNVGGDWQVQRWTKISVSAPIPVSAVPSVPSVPVSSVKIDVFINEGIQSKLLDFQPPSVEKLVRSMKYHKAALDASECGLGKTFCALATARILGYAAFVICRKAAIPTWEKAADYMEVRAEIINIEAIRAGNTRWGEWIKGETENAAETFQWEVPPNYMMILDECHCIKNKSQNAEMLISAKNQNIPILLLSATAASNPLEMRAIGYILDLFDLKNYWKWAAENGVKKGKWGMEFIGGPHHLQNIHKTIFQDAVPRGSRLRIKDVPSFPEALIIGESLDFDGKNPQIQAAYDQMQEEIARLQARMDKDTGACVLTAILRARQKVELLKVPTLVEMAEDLVKEGNSVVIGCSFKETIAAFSAKLKTNCIIDGDHTDNIREKNRVDFQVGRERIIIASILAGGESIDLDDQIGEFPRVTLLCPDFSAIRIKQFIGRTHRAKSVTKAIIKFCYASGTIEDKMRRAVMVKSRNIECLTDGDLSGGLSI